MEMSDQLYCDADLHPMHWRHSELGIGKVCNTPVEKDRPCPNAHRHMEE